jgi:tripartite-type tricarboxylate transporter receptor subunit TctC
MITKRSFLMATGGAGLVLANAGPSWPQPYPQRGVKIVVAGLAGVPFDLLARAIADKLSANLKQPFIVEDRPGAAGNLGAAAVARSTPDGHTMLLALETTFTVNPSLYKNPPFDPIADFKFLTLAARSPNMLIVHPSVPVNSVAEFVAYAKKEPISYAHGGNGSPGHLCMEYFRLLAGFRTVPVAYRGISQLTTDLLSGQIKFGFVGVSGVIQHVRAGRLKGLAISSRERSLLAPEVPTIAELGYPDFDFVIHFPLAVPSATPGDIVSLLERELRNALTSPDVQERFLPLDMKIAPSTGAEAKARIESDARLWAKVVEATGMHVD